MSYIWQDFNIKTFAAETVVFRDGLFCPELSTLDNPVIDKNYDLPVHFIYVGKLSGDNNFDIVVNENVKNQKIYISGKITVEKNAVLNVSVKNSGENSVVRGFFICENHGDIKFNLDAYHLCRNTGIFIKNKLLAYKNTSSKMTGTAHIYKYCENCGSDIGFSALSEENAKIIFMPVQRISSVPEKAEHSANIAHYTNPQIEYLHGSGLTDAEIKNVLHEAFVNDIDLFE